MEKQTYRNRWIPAGAMDVLCQQDGRILDVGGGAAPFARAAHIIDIQPYDGDRLQRNAWGRSEDGGPRTEDRGQSTEGDQNEEQRTKNHVRTWSPADYTQFDLCSGEKWPFDDKSFDLGLSSHCLEDIRDPVQVVKEMARCCRQTLVICPSRLFEQMRGVDHPRYCGMPHHLWLVSENEGVLEFRRKTQIIEFPGLHRVCPPGKVLSTEAGSMFYLREQPDAREVMYFDANEDKCEYAEFIANCADLNAVLEPDGEWKSWRQWIWYFRQKYGYEV